MWPSELRSESVGTALGTRRIWPAEPPRSKRVEPGGERHWVQPNRDGKDLTLVVNPDAGPKRMRATLEESRAGCRRRGS